LVHRRITGEFVELSIYDKSSSFYWRQQVVDKYIRKAKVEDSELPEIQGNSLGRDIIDYACKYAERNYTAIYLDCYSGNKKLREFYLKSGLDYVGDFPEEDYFVSVFRYEPYKPPLCS
jgi:RimJ/RimL family protein N-acetyltransferase